MSDNLNNKRVMFGGGRDYSVDMMRCISCMMVVAIHACAMSARYYPFDSIDTISETWMSVSFLKSATVSATNLFLMISGIFFLSPERNVTPSKVWSKNILKLALAYVVWSVIYALMRIYYVTPRPFEMSDFINECLTQEVHLWYIPMMLGIYMLVPLMRLITLNAEKKHYVYMVGLMIGAMTLNTIVLFDRTMDFPHDYQLSTIVSFTPTAMICQYPFFCILGYFIYTYPPKLKTRILIYFLGILGILFTFASTVTVYVNAANPDPALIQDKFAIGILAKNTAIFIFVITLFSKIRMHKAFTFVLSKISAATLFIYLFHPVALKVLFKNQCFFVDELPVFKTAVLDTLIAYFAGVVISIVLLQLIPWVKMKNLVLDAVWPTRKIWNGGKRFGGKRQ